MLFFIFTQQENQDLAQEISMLKCSFEKSLYWDTISPFRAPPIRRGLEQVDFSEFIVNGFDF